MDQDELQLELKKIDTLMNDLDEYEELTISDLPKDVKDRVFDVKVLPEITTSGLEKIYGILDNLQLAKLIVENHLNNGTPIFDEKLEENTTKNETAKTIDKTTAVSRGPQPKSQLEANKNNIVKPANQEVNIPIKSKGTSMLDLDTNISPTQQTTQTQSVPNKTTIVSGDTKKKKDPLDPFDW